MPLKALKYFLDSHNVKYSIISHSTAYTAQEIAELAHIPGMELAKTVVVWIDEDLALAVLPASHQIDLYLLKEAAGARTVAIATEAEFKDRFPDCEVGAMPPFGNLFGMKVFAEKILARDKEIAFNAGSHHELVRLSYDEFERLAMPQVAKFSAGRFVSTAR